MSDKLTFPISAAIVASILAKWGPDVLKLVIDGLAHGFSMEFMQEVLSTLGPIFLGQAVNARKVKLKMGCPGCDTDPCDTEDCCDKQTCCTSHHKFGDAPIIQGEQVTTNPLGSILVDALMKILETEGPQITAALSAWLLSVLKQPTTKAQLTAILQDAFTK